MERWLIFIQISPDLLSYTTWNSLSMATDRKRKYRANMYSDPDLAGTENDNPWLISTFFKSWENSRCNNVNHHLLRYCNFFRYRLKFGCSKYQKGVGGCHVHVGLWPPPLPSPHIYTLQTMFSLEPPSQNFLSGSANGMDGSCNLYTKVSEVCQFFSFLNIKLYIFKIENQPFAKNRKKVHYVTNGPIFKDLDR